MPIHVPFKDTECEALERCQRAVWETLPWSELQDYKTRLRDCLASLNTVYASMYRSGDRWETNPEMRPLFDTIKRRERLQKRVKDEIARRQALYLDGQIAPEMAGYSHSLRVRKSGNAAPPKALGSPHAGIVGDQQGRRGGEPQTPRRHELRNLSRVPLVRNERARRSSNTTVTHGYQTRSVQARLELAWRVLRW